MRFLQDSCDKISGVPADLQLRRSSQLFPVLLPESLCHRSNHPPFRPLSQISLFANLLFGHFIVHFQKYSWLKLIQIISFFEIVLYHLSISANDQSEMSVITIDEFLLRLNIHQALFSAVSTELVKLSQICPHSQLILCLFLFGLYICILLFLLLPYSLGEVNEDASLTT